LENSKSFNFEVLKKTHRNAFYHKCILVSSSKNAQSKSHDGNCEAAAAAAAMSDTNISKTEECEHFLHQQKNKEIAKFTQMHTHYIINRGFL
jgi:hypothetical protein